MSRDISRNFGAICIAILTVIVYAQSLGNGFVNLDDPLLIYENQAVQSFDIATAFTTYDPELYIPVTLFSYQIEHAIFGLNPTAYHVTSLLLHIGSGIFIFLILSRLLGVRWIALLCALLFAVHPLNTEAVAWAAARKDVLSSFFFFASLWSYLRYIDTNKRYAYVLSILLFLGGLLSKVSVLMLPAVLILVDWLLQRHVSRKTMFEKIPFMLLSIIFFAVALGGKSQLLVSTTLWQKTLIAGKSTMFYLLKFFVPTELSVLYPYAGLLHIASAGFLISWMLLAILAVLTLWSVRRTKAIAFGGGFFLLMLLPSFGTVSKSGGLYFASDRYMYAAAFGMLFILGSYLVFLRSRGSIKALRIATAAAAVAVCIFGYGANLRAKVWADNESLYGDVLRKYPQSSLARYNQAVVDKENGNVEEAIAGFFAVLKTNPNDANSLINLSVIYAEQHNYAESTIERFSEVVSAIPDDARAHHNLAVAYYKNGHLDAAITGFLTVLELDPGYTQARHALAETYGTKELYKDAVEQYRIIIETDPQYAEANNIRIPGP